MFGQQDPFDVLFNKDDFKPFEYPVFGEDSEVFLEQELLDKLELNVEFQKNASHQGSSTQEENRFQNIKSNQSILHNCPKNLIKHVVKCLDFPTSNIIQLEKFSSLDENLKSNIMNLLYMLEVCSKGKAKSLSKELLKLVYEEGSQNNNKIKLLQSPTIKKLLLACHSDEMAEAKEILRAFTLQKLQNFKSSHIDNPHQMRRSINQRYLQIFKSQLRSGKVTDRVSKQDKEWILQIKNF